MNNVERAKRRDAKRKQREKSKRMRGSQWLKLRRYLSVNRYHKAMTMRDDDQKQTRS